MRVNRAGVRETDKRADSRRCECRCGTCLSLRRAGGAPVASSGWPVAPRSGAISAAMVLFDVTFPTPAENLAADEALLEQCEAGGPEVLRFWEPATPFVVLGYANQAAREVNLDACRARAIPVMRRITGGGAVLQAPGCLNYSLVLRIQPRGPTATVPATNLWVLNRHAAALTARLGQPIRRRGDTDLAIGDLKFSGNSQRRGRHALLFHGSVLLGLDLHLLEALLPLPSRQPDYRENRPHREFVANLGVEASLIKAALTEAWDARPGAFSISPERVGELAAAKYARDEWIFKF